MSVVQGLNSTGRRTRSLASRKLWQRSRRRKRMIAIIISRYSVAHNHYHRCNSQIKHATYRSKPSQARNLISGNETNVCSAERRIKSTCDAIATITRPKTMTNIAVFRRRSCLFRFLGYFHNQPEVGLTKIGELWDFRRFRHNGNSRGWLLRL